MKEKVYNICCECNKRWITEEDNHLALSNIFSNCSKHNENKFKES